MEILAATDRRPSLRLRCDSTIIILSLNFGCIEYFDNTRCILNLGECMVLSMSAQLSPAVQDVVVSVVLFSLNR